LARNTTYIDASPARIFEVLSDPRTYAHWVVGSREVRAADQDWPAPGTSFDHTVGVPPLTNTDATSVISAHPPRKLQLRARARPFPTARVTLEVESQGGGSRVVMTEEPMRRRLSMLMGPMGHGLIWLRNTESLKRLKALAEGATASPEGDLPARARPRPQGAGVG
jgi:uncharacterized protein YndB with AHSA1/START domain